MAASPPVHVGPTELDEKASIKDKDELPAALPSDEKKGIVDPTNYGEDIKVIDVDELAAQGDVYETVRPLDMDESGKERSFETAWDWSVRLVSLEDDPMQPVWTLRMLFLAVGLGCFGAVLSQIFVFRPTTIYVSHLFIQTFAYILGKIYEEFIPGPQNPIPFLRTRDTAFWRFVNPGSFNIKEHTAILIMSAAAVHGALAINIFAAEDLYYHFTISPAKAIFTLLGSQLLGYGLAGLMRSFLVYPTVSSYPNLFPTIQMFDLLHRGHSNVLQQKRIKVFWIAFVGVFIWQWFPEYIAPLLTGFSIFCLARRDSPWVTRLFGGTTSNEGLGLFSICFDWNYIGSGGSAYGPLFQPLWTQLSQYIGMVLCIIVFCAIYVQNIWKAQNFPFLSQLLYYENGTEYDQLLILNDDYTLNREKLEEQGLPWLAPSNMVGKIAYSMGFGASVMHILLWCRKDIWRAITEARDNTIVDPHYERMKAYKEAPLWWYGGVLVVSIAMGLATNQTSGSQLPWWAFLIAVGFAAVFLPIVGFLYSTVCFVPSTSDVARIFGSALTPGRPIANMYFTMYAYNSIEQGRSMTRDLKMGQYIKLPPRVTFTMQTVGAVIGALLNYVIMKIVIDQRREILLDVQGTNVWSGGTIQAFNSDAVAWGALAKDLYSPSGRYGMVPLSILFGLAVPIPFWLVHHYWPQLKANLILTPMLLSSIAIMNGGITSNYFMQFLLCLFSQFYLRKYKPGFFRKYNFLLSAALDGGTEVMIFVYTFAVGGAGGKAIDFPRWALNPKGNPDYCMKLN
ncbi:OPT oligopeptide transporter [Flagelloscypha sp. PMI_526]|nr:OPT oligopeptide transporter [Flagelloscypha sp. PMI_526]